MIHSMAGGELRGEDYNDFAKVEILEGEQSGKSFWYITTIFDMQVGDKVLVPVGNIKMGTLGKVVRIDKNVSSFCSPVPTKRARYVLRKVNK